MCTKVSNYSKTILLMDPKKLDVILAESVTSVLVSKDFSNRLCPMKYKLLFLFVVVVKQQMIYVI